MYFLLILLSFGINIVCEKGDAARSQFQNEKVDIYEYVYVTNDSSILYWVDRDVQKDGNLRIKYNKLLYYQQAQFLSEDNFEISLTTRIRENVLTIFLCDKENVFQSSCYWFSDSNFNNGGRAELRECQQDFIFLDYDRKIQRLCKLLRQEFYDTQYFNEEDVTNEFKIYKQENYIRLVKGNGIKEMLLMEYRQRNIFNVKNALIYSEDEKIAIWKINKIEYEPSIRSFATSERKKRNVLDDNDFLKIQDVDTRFVRVNFTKHKASLLKDSTVMLDCISTWCKELVLQRQCTVNSLQCEIDRLQPFTEYKITFIFCSKNKNCSDDVDLITTQFKTKATAPSSIRHVEVYSKNESSISLRWEPPYPPTGTLSHYNISYHLIEQEPKEDDSFLIQPCSLWPNFHCHILIGLQNNSSYIISLEAANQENPKLYGQSSDSITVITKKEPSEAPYDLDVEWNVENNLILKWKHPNVTNGDIQFFNIILIPTDYKYKTIKKVLYTTDRLQYCYEINATELSPSVDYIINITAYNGFDGKESLPIIPFFSYVPKPKVVEKTIALELSVENLKPEYRKNLQNYRLFVFISNDEKKRSKDIPKILERFKLRLSKYKYLYKCTFKKARKLKFNIGKNDATLNCDKISNYFIDRDNETYNVTVILTNTYKDRTSYKIYSWSVGNTKVEQSSTLIVTLLILVVILFLILIGLFIYLSISSVFEKRICLKTSLIIVVILLLILVGLFIYLKKIGFKCYAPNINLQGLMSKSGEAEEISLMQYTCQKAYQYSNRIMLSDFEQYVKQSIMNGALERQYDLITGDTGKPCDYGTLKENKPKNRYVNLIAYDHSRVVLQKLEGKEYSDYINANYIDGYKTSKVYIATQAPTKSTVFDFWRMIWQENVRNIFMLAKINEGDKYKVIQYWPDVNSSMSFENINVDYVSSKAHADYQQTIFRVMCNGQLRIVEHFHFTSWPDHGVPLYPQTLVPLLEELHNLPLSSDSPIVVHCNAGVGRTGTILLCDICLRMADKEEAIDVVGNFQKLREHRSNMVSNVQQYKLVHLVILEYVFGKKTGIPCASMEAKVEDLINDGRVKLQMEYLEEIMWKDDAMKSVVPTEQNYVGIEEKSRFPGIIPESQGIILLTSYSLSDDPTSSFINAVTVDGFKMPNKFIVTQQPLPNTVGDFWRLVHQRGVLLVLSLNNIDLDDPSSCIFWPIDDKPLLKPEDYLILKHIKTTRSESYDNITIQLSDRYKEEERLIEILSINSWSPGASLPNDKKEFLTFLEQARIMSKKSEQIVVTCYDGATASGLYVAMDFVIEMMNFGQICDVCQAVRTVRHNRKQFIRNEDQLAFLYKVAVDFQNLSQLYANFN